MRKLLFVLSMFLITLSQLYGQKTKGDKYLKVHQFEKAINAYKEALFAEDSSVIPDLANAYRLHNDLKNAETWYAQAILRPFAKPIEYFYYSEVLIANEKYEEGMVQMRKYQKLVAGKDTRPSRYLQDDHYFEKLLLDIGKFEVENAKHLNTSGADFGPCWYKDSTLLITSTGLEYISTKKSQNYDHEITTDIYHITKGLW